MSESKPHFRVIVRLLPLVLAAMGIFPAGSQAVEFQQPTGSPFTLAVGQGFLFMPSDMAVGDLNGDGRSDVVTSNWSPSSYSVMLADAAGALNRQASSPNALSLDANGVTLGDFDNDGDLDAAFASHSSGTGGSVTIYAGDGAGGFAGSPAGSNSIGVNANGIGTGDFNGDGIDDVVVSDSEGDRVHFLLGVEGSLNLIPFGDYPSGAAPIAVTVGDFNNDGRDDVATANMESFFSEAFTVYLSSGSSGYTRTALGGSYRPMDVVSGRFGSSGNLGLAQGNSPNTDIPLKIGAGDGTFTDLEGPRINSRYGGELAAADFNGDGIDDLVAPYGTPISGQGDMYSLFLGQSDGSMSQAPGSPFSLEPLTGPGQIQPGDFNGDGKPDFAVTNLSEKVAVFLNMPPEISVDPDEVDFGGMPVGGAEIERSVEIGSEGSIPLNVSGFSIVGDDPADFSFEDQGCTDGPLAQGETCEVRLEFDAAEVGNRAADLKISSDADPEGTIVPLSGTGQQNPAASISPDPAYFFGVKIGEGPSDPTTFTVTSNGTTPLEVDTASLTGGDSDQFEIVADDCSGESITPGQSCEVDVVLDPTRIGELNTELQVVSNTNEPAKAEIIGWGVENPVIEVEPWEVDFGDVPADGKPGVPKEITVKSRGTTPLEIGEIELGGNDPEVFQIVSDHCSQRDVDPGESCEVQVAFSPTELGGVSASLEIPSNAGDGPFPVDLNGTGVEVSREIVVTPGSADFGRIVVGQGPSAAQSFTVSSRGNSSLDIGSVTLAGAEPQQFRLLSDSCSDSRLNPDENCRIEVAFTPDRIGQLSARLEIASDATGDPVSVDLSGLGEAGPVPCEPVTVERVAKYRPAIIRRSQSLGVRARFKTSTKAVVKVRAKVKIRSGKRTLAFKSGLKRLQVTGKYRNYKLAIPRKLRRLVRFGDRATVTVSYSSRALRNGCQFGPERTRRLNTRVIWVRPSR